MYITISDQHNKTKNVSRQRPAISGHPLIELQGVSTGTVGAGQEKSKRNGWQQVRRVVARIKDSCCCNNNKKKGDESSRKEASIN
jgi:hypothetical protein